MSVQNESMEIKSADRKPEAPELEYKAASQDSLSMFFAAIGGAVLGMLATLLVLGGLGYGLIKRQYDSLQVLAKKKGEDDSKLQLMETAVKNADELSATLAEVAKALAEKEATMASGVP